LLQAKHDKQSGNGSDAVALAQPVVTRGRGRPKLYSDEEQKSRIVRHALVLFVRDGYTATSMDDVAADCRVSKRTLYRLFPSKIELFGALVDEHRASMLAFPPLKADVPLEEQLADVFMVDIGPEADLQRSAFIGMAIVESRNVPELGEILREQGGDKSRQMLADWLGAARAAGLIDVDEPLAAAGILMDMMFGAIALKTGQDAQWPGTSDRPAYMRQCIRYFVNGIRHR
jgi:AcrR family transcriptional regulator